MSQRDDGQSGLPAEPLRRGEEAIMGHLAHTFLFEAGGSAAVGGIHPALCSTSPMAHSTWATSRPPYGIQTTPLPSHAVDLPGEHPQSLQRSGAHPGVYGPGPSAGRPPRPQDPPRRGAGFRRSDRVGCQRGHSGPRRRFSQLLPVKRAVGAGRLAGVRLGRVCAAGTPAAQGAGGGMRQAGVLPRPASSPWKQ